MKSPLDGEILINQLKVNLTSSQKELIEQQLALYINDLVINNFNALVQLLYKIDISEEKLKRILLENKDQDAGMLIAKMLIERQEQKLRSRQDFKRNEDVSDEDKW